jgi:colanic acid/amylovoran/stewartan biosynthesis glycosyltransferase WcaL/AmsK/CpsK
MDNNLNGRKRIAAIVDEFPSMSQTFILDQIKGLIGLGNKVDIFASRLGKAGAFHQDAVNNEFYEKITYFKNRIRRMPKNILLKYAKCFPHIIKSFRVDPKAVAKSINFAKYGRKAISLNNFLSIEKFIGRGPYDIIHCHFGPYGNLGIMLKDLGVFSGKVITAFHGFDLSSFLKERGPRVYDELFVKGDLFLPISEKWRHTLIEMGCPKEKIIVHRMGIDIEKFRYKDREINNREEIRIVSIARLIEKKGIKYGIKGVSKLCALYPNISYDIVGDGPIKNDLKRMINVLGLQKQIKLIGWQSHKKIVSLLGKANIMLAPSVVSRDGDHEGIPVAIMEAMASGLPVISTYHSGIPELIQNGKTGLLSKERDTEGLSNHLKNIIENSELPKKIAKKAREKIVKDYNLNVLNSRLNNIFNEVNY